MNSPERGQIEADRLEAGRKEAIEHGHEGLTMEATAALYGRDASAVRHAALNHEAEAVRFTITTGGRDLKMIGKDWADAYWGGCGDTYEHRLRALREESLTCWIPSYGGMWLLLGVAAKEVRS